MLYIIDDFVSYFYFLIPDPEGTDEVRVYLAIRAITKIWVQPKMMMYVEIWNQEQLVLWAWFLVGLGVGYLQTVLCYSNGVPCFASTYKYMLFSFDNARESQLCSFYYCTLYGSLHCYDNGLGFCGVVSFQNSSSHPAYGFKCNSITSTPTCFDKGLPVLMILSFSCSSLKATKY